MSKAYIARETIAPAFPWRKEEFAAAEEAVEKAWENACANVQAYLM